MFVCMGDVLMFVCMGDVLMFVCMGDVLMFVCMGDVGRATPALPPCLSGPVRTFHRSSTVHSLTSHRIH